MDLRTPLGKVKGLGSAKSGSHHWWMQRVTAIALIPLVIWFVLNVIKASTSSHNLIDILSSPFNAVGMILFITVALYHGTLGFKVIIEDYVHCGCGKNFLIIASNFFTVVTVVATVLAVIYFHLGGVPKMKSSDYQKCHKNASYEIGSKEYKNCNRNKQK
jgi:succinate dehydrogenase / fumarate reductase membrane anchor subunit